VGNGVVVASIPLPGDRTSADAVVRLPAARSGWYVLRAYAERSRHPVLDLYPFATTSPVYVTVDGAPVRSPEDARSFMDWIDRLQAFAERHPGWKRRGETAVLRQRAARAVYARQAGRPETRPPWLPPRDDGGPPRLSSLHAGHDEYDNLAYGYRC
jgi:hypothetical protein